MAFVDPKGNIAQLGKIEGLQVADFGAGTGVYTMLLAQKVGDTGRVYAIEVQKDFLSRIRDAAQDTDLTNIEVLWGDIERLGATKLSDNSIDIVVLANVFFQVDDKRETLEEVKRVLVPQGRVLFVDWKDSYGGIGPQQDMIVKPDSVRQVFDESGFSLQKSIETGDQHYGFIFMKK
ncbi:MAG: class I SAM-dependent methyltransferase [Candidatus Pacebacteria bacterium]|nr:class I SAM-dependent methyltransferase [Candidatus Paceibacterota bacterium]